MSKSPQQIFEEVIARSIKRLQQYYAQTNKEQLDQFKERLKLLDKGVRELDANPYFFLFIYMVSTKSQALIQQALKNIEILLSEHFLTPSKSPELWQNLVSLLRKSIPLKSQQSANIISQLTHPNAQTFQLIFDVLEYTQSEKVQSACVNLLGRVFEFKYKYSDDFQRKVTVLLEPSKHIEYGYQLVTPEELNQLLTYYVKKVVVDMVDRIQILQGEAVKGTGKFGLCFMCRQLADHYCKDTKVPVCGSNCKKAHLQELQKVSMGTVHFPLEDKRAIEGILFKRISTTQNPNVRSLVLWCLIKVLSLSQYTLTRNLQISESPTDTLDFKKNLLQFYYLVTQQRGQLCEYIFHNLLLYSQSQQYSMLLQNYFVQLFADKRLFKVFYNFDLQKDRVPIIKSVLQFLSKTNKKMGILLMQQLLETILSNHPPNTLTGDMVVQIERTHTLIGLFNSSDKKLFQAEVQKRATEENAHFVYKNERFLNKERVIAYLTKQQNTVILREYLTLLDITKMELEFALREVFFHLSPRESQQIYRLIEEFCKIYRSQRFPTEDQLFQFSYFIIMLQTQLHNPVVEKRTTYDEMIKRVAVFNKQLSEDTEYMTSLYRNIQNRPFSQSTKALNFLHMYSLAQRSLAQYHPCLIVYQNWQTIYVVVSADLSFKSLEVTYKTAVFLINFKISQHFQHLLIRELYQRPFADNYTLILSRWVFDLLVRQPNYIEKQWPKIFHLFYRYQSLRESVENGTRPDLIRELQIAQSIISDQVILKTFEISQVLSDDQLVQMCQGVCTVPLIYFLNLIPMLVQINFKRLHVFWKSLSTFIGLEPNYILKTMCFGETIRLIYSTQAPDQDHISMVVKDSLNLLQWTPDKQPLFFQFALNIINSCGKMFTNHVWQLFFEYFHKLSVKNRISLCRLLKQICPIYLNFIKDDTLRNQSLEFLKANQQLIQANQKVFEPCISKYKSEEVLRFFISQAFKDFIIKNVDALPPSKELYSVIRKTQIEKEDFPKLQKYLEAHLLSIKNIESECVHLIVHLMTTPHKEEGYKLFEKLIESNRIQMAEYQKDFKSKDPNIKTSSKQYDALVKKTLNQVTIINCLADEFPKIDNDILEKVLKHIEDLITFSTTFNRNIPLRHYLWKNGLVKSLKQLPGLLKTQRNSEMVRFSIWDKFKSKQCMNKMVRRWNQIVDRLITILREWREKDKNSQDEIVTHYFNEIEREISDYRKLLPKVFPHLKEVRWEEVQKQNKVKWLNSCCRILTNGLFRFKQEGLNQGVSQDEETLSSLFQNVTSTL